MSSVSRRRIRNTEEVEAEVKEVVDAEERNRGSEVDAKSQPPKRKVVIGISARQTRNDQIRDYSDRKYNLSLCSSSVKSLRKMHRLRLYGDIVWSLYGDTVVWRCSMEIVCR